jgi:DNA helicase IV
VRATIYTKDVQAEINKAIAADDDLLTAVVAATDTAGRVGAMMVADVKGLEFDRVVVVEPAAIVRDGGLTGLCVA